ncbi:hypothetical protein K7C98_11810 [Nannocystis pusilla]|uniref:Lipoprotein n=1 Tax=Nannocystis pusilla TaxID=889268 RepID=A0ABS7TP10_9BACT|nr:hypothetical protein [Nannocystis pusilla]
MVVRPACLGALIFASACAAESDPCGPAPEPTPCTPDEVTDPRAEICAKRTAEDCDGPIGLADNNDTCQWVSTTSYPKDASECGAAKEGGACVALSAFGDGCEVATACAGAVEGTVYFRTTATCETEMFLGNFCGSTLVGWNSCAWTEPAADMCALPYPDAGPALCNCHC